MAILQLSFANAFDMPYDHVICIFQDLFLQKHQGEQHWAWQVILILCQVKKHMKVTIIQMCLVFDVLLCVEHYDSL